MDTREQLRLEYRKTWEAFSRHMKAVHELAGAGEIAAVETAMQNAELAMAAHQDARNNFAAALTPAVATRKKLSVKAWQRNSGPAAPLTAISR